MVKAKKKTVKKQSSPKKKKPSQKKKQDEIVHVGISNPADVYRLILETSKGTIEHLREFERLTTVREEKNKLLKDFSKLVNSMKSDVAFIEKQLPKQDVHFTLPQESVIVKRDEVKLQAVTKVSQPVEEKKVIREPSSEIEKLEMELQAIENKLSGL